MSDTETPSPRSRHATVTSLHDESSQPIVFSSKVIEHALRPKHLARLDHPDGCSAVCGWCGEVMEVYLRLNGTTIEQATFWADGCISTMACGDMLADMVQGLTLAEATAITAEDVQAALGGLPYASVHCSELAVAALKEALDVTVHVYPGSRCIGMPIPSHRLPKPAGGYVERHRQSVFHAICACIRGQLAPFSNPSYPNREQLSA